MIPNQDTSTAECTLAGWKGVLAWKDFVKPIKHITT